MAKVHVLGLCTYHRNLPTSSYSRDIDLSHKFTGSSSHLFDRSLPMQVR